MCLSHYEVCRRSCERLGALLVALLAVYFKFETMLKQHGCHNILQRHTFSPAYCHHLSLHRTMAQNRPSGSERPISPRKRLMVCCIGLQEPPQSPDLSLVEKGWDELCGKKKQPSMKQVSITWQHLSAFI